MGMTAENLANSHQISRSTQELFAASSHKKAINAQNLGFFADEIVEISGVKQDGCMREPNLEKMAQLKPAFDENGTVTAA